MAGSKPGERRGGRQKGTPNKKAMHVEERLKNLGCDPLGFLAEVVLGNQIEARLPATPEQSDPVMLTPSLEQRIAAAKELAQYVAPKRKAIEGGPEGSQPVAMHISWDD